MNTLASTIELGAHPATALLLGGIAAAVLRGKYAAVVLVLSPLFGLFHVYGMEIGAVSNLNLFGYEILSVSVDQQAKVFGYLFHIAALVAGIYSFHVRDPWQVSMALFYAASAVGRFCRRYVVSVFMVEGLAVTSVFQIWGVKPKPPRIPAFAIFSSMCHPGCFCFWCSLRYHGEGAAALSLDSLTGALENGDFGALLILLAIGIRLLSLDFMYG